LYGDKCLRAEYLFVAAGFTVRDEDDEYSGPPAAEE
jgi:hypothetical protein